MASKLWNLRLDDETRTRWEGWADRDGYDSLAEFVKAAAEEKGSGRTSTTALGGGKRSYEPDFKPGKNGELSSRKEPKK